jgi:hypothetical protein
MVLAKPTTINSVARRPRNDKMIAALMQWAELINSKLDTDFPGRVQSD